MTAINALVIVDALGALATKPPVLRATLVAIGISPICLWLVQ